MGWVSDTVKSAKESTAKAIDWVGGYGTTIENRIEKEKKKLPKEAQKHAKELWRSINYDQSKVEKQAVYHPHKFHPWKGQISNVHGGEAKAVHPYQFIKEFYPLVPGKGIAIRAYKTAKWINKTKKASKSWKKPQIKIPTKIPLVGKNIKNSKIGNKIKIPLGVKVPPRVKDIPAKLPRIVKKNKGKIGTAAAASGILKSITEQNGAKRVIKDEEEYQRWV